VTTIVQGKALQPAPLTVIADVLGVHNALVDHWIQSL